jgi:hypothetical protein
LRVFQQPARPLAGILAEPSDQHSIGASVTQDDGEQRGRNAISGEFDVNYYIETYPDIAANSLDAFDHFWAFGWKEGRNPCAWFSTNRYIERYEDVRNTPINPFLHYILIGRAEGREIFPAEDEKTTESENHVTRDTDLIRSEFDPHYYRERYPDIGAGNIDPLGHFCAFGWQEGRNPAAWFSTSLYQNFYPRIEGNPFVHYITEGRVKDFLIWPADHKGPRVLVVDQDAKLVNDGGLLDLVRFESRPLRYDGRFADPSNLAIHLVIPDFSVGSGGHMTIFRLVRWLEFARHECTIWINNLDQHRRIERASDDILKYFQTIKAKIKLLDDTFFETPGDVVVATGWQTVAAVGHATNFLERFYLVQDFEPSFYPTGSYSLSAENTYRQQDFACICASPWLATLMSTHYGRWASRLLKNWSLRDAERIFVRERTK